MFYENKKSINFKLEYIKEHNLGGIAVSSIDLDDFNGIFCKSGKFPLLNSIHENFFHLFPAEENEIIQENTTVDLKLIYDQKTDNQVIIFLY